MPDTGNTSSEAGTSRKLWDPSRNRIEGSNLFRYLNVLKKSGYGDFQDYHSLHQWSVSAPEQFWQSVWEFVQIKASKAPLRTIDNPKALPGARWFEGAELNFAENLLRHENDSIAVTFWSEDTHKSTLSYRELRSEVAKIAAFLRSCGVAKGDRVAGYIPNMPEAIISMLAAASIGAVWSSCSPDFGVTGVLDRFGQIEPKVLVVADGYNFKGAAVSYLEKVAEVSKALPSLTKILVAPLIGATPPARHIANLISWSELPPAKDLHFEQLPFDHPLYIMYSSGTTGKPKCIVHGAGGTLLEHLKELILHTDLKTSDVFTYQTTCGWMMWNWLVSGLATGCKLVLYDGFPLHRSGRTIFDLLSKEKVSVFGTNAKFLALIEKEGLTPKSSHELSHLHTILSTGSVLLPESFDYVYQSIKTDVCLSSISGGTDIIGCFSVGCPILPVYRGATQCISLGADVQVYSVEGKRVFGEKGELVCTNAFPSMPIYFWNDPQGEKRHKAYFARFPGVWHHGDFILETPYGGHIYYGRSDATLKPGGVRIGTAEIYQQVEKLPEIQEALVVGQEWDGDTRVVLFVRMVAGATLTSALIQKIQKTIRAQASPYHVPRKVIAVTDLPRTRSNKIAELAVRDLIHGREIQNTEALANPECLEQFRNHPELIS